MARRIFLAGAVLIGGAGSFLLPARAQDSSGEGAYTAPPTSNKKRQRPDDAYSPPAGQGSYLQPLGTPSGGKDDDMWTRPSGGGGNSGPSRSFPSSPGNSVMRDAIPPTVDKGDLAPVMSSDGSGLPYELWGGMDVAALEKLIATIEIPPRSPVLHDLWKKLITSPSGDSSNSNFTALRQIGRAHV